jgi:hypothetical protein
MLEHGRAVTCQIFNEPDGSPLGPADQSCKPPLSLDQWQVAQVVAVMPDQVEREQHRLIAPASAPQRTEVRRPVITGDHGLAVDQERLRREASGGFDNSREAVGPIMAVARKPSRRTINR